MNVPEVLAALLQLTGWTQEQLAERLGTGQTNISRWLAGSEPRGLAIDAIRSLAEEYAIIPLRHLPERESVIPIMGKVGAGGVISQDGEQIPEGGLYQVELPFSYPAKMLGFEVEGVSMEPHFNPGDIVVCFVEPRKALEEYIGRNVVVRTDANERFLKRLEKGRSPRRFDLVSWNHPTKHDVRIEWLGEIVAIVADGIARRIEPKRSDR
jgi:repressor LexA